MAEAEKEAEKATEGEKKVESKGKPRVLRANREQEELRPMTLDELVAEDHRVRIVWAMAQRYDLRAFYEGIKAVEGEAGRPAIDPLILVALWLYATTEGVGSARELERLCREHVAYQWILGGVRVNYHTLADFRVGYEERLDAILTKSVAALMSAGIVKLERMAQDGVRVRASAGSNSFRRKKRLEVYLEEAEKQVEELKEQGQKEREESNQRKQAAQKRVAREREERVGKALEEIEKVQKVKEKSHKKKSEQREARCSTTDPEARVMKMADGGFRPAFNGEFSTDTESGIVAGVTATNEVDQGQMEPMLEQVGERYAKKPQEYLMDGGFVTPNAIEMAFEQGVKVYAPVKIAKTAPSEEASRPSRAKEKGPGVIDWEERMKTEEAKKIYPQRSSTSEWVNAQARNRGMQSLPVRGLHKVKSIFLWYALVHNLWVTYRLEQQALVAMAGGC